MDRILSTYMYAHQSLAPALLASIAHAGIQNLEIFCAASHFNYGDPQAPRELANSLDEYRITLHSLHAPMDRDAAGGRAGGITISIADPERIRRIEAVDEMKRALDVAEKIPFRYFALHLATGRQPADPRKFDAAFNSLEHWRSSRKSAVSPSPCKILPMSLAPRLPWRSSSRKRISTMSCSVSISATRTSKAAPPKAIT